MSASGRLSRTKKAIFGANHLNNLPHATVYARTTWGDLFYQIVQLAPAEICESPWIQSPEMTGVQAFFAASVETKLLQSLSIRSDLRSSRPCDPQKGLNKRFFVHESRLCSYWVVHSGCANRVDHPCKTEAEVRMLCAVKNPAIKFDDKWVRCVRDAGCDRSLVGRPERQHNARDMRIYSQLFMRVESIEPFNQIARESEIHGRRARCERFAHIQDFCATEGKVMTDAGRSALKNVTKEVFGYLPHATLGWHQVGHIGLQFLRTTV
jgi:hypothetical protein